MPPFGVCENHFFSPIYWRYLPTIYTGPMFQGDVGGYASKIWFYNMGVSENSVPLNPMVNDHYPY